MKAGETAAVEVMAIANGLLVRERRSNGCTNLWTEWLFFPDMEAVERELVFRLRNAITLTTESATEDF